MTDFHGHRRETDDPCDPPPGVTLAQLDFFTEQTDRAVRKALAKFSRRALVGFLVLFAASVGNVLYASHISQGARNSVVTSGDAVAIASCNRDFRSTETLRSLLRAAAASSAEQGRKGEIPPHRAAAAKKFYADQLKALELPDCRASDDILTDDPDAVITVPEPLYPGSPAADKEAG